MRLVNSYASIAVDIDCSPNPSVKPAAISQVCCVSENTNHSKSDFGLCFDACRGDFFKVVWKKRFFFCCFFIQRVFIPNRKPVRKTGAALEKKFVIILQQPFNHCRPMSRIADRNLLKNFNTSKKCVFTIITTPTSQRF